MNRSARTARGGRATPSGVRYRAAMVWLRADDCSVEELASWCEVAVEPEDHPHADRIVDRTPIYRAADLEAAARADPAAVEEELAGALLDRSGAIVVEGAVRPDAVDRATAVYREIIAGQRRLDGDIGDHFAESGANDRIWNSLEKLALRAPDVFVDYFSAPTIDLVCRAYLGPGYAMSAQINVVNPGGAAQSPHRDYHLGFLEDGEAERYPAHVHRLSPLLTLQGAVAHDATPIASGPTKFLPGSQRYEPGYVAWQRPDVAAYFESHCTQLPLAKGDMLFFSPALFHAAGANRTSDVSRMVNLFQVSSPFGRNLESIDRRAIVEAIYPELVGRTASGDLPAVRRVLASAAHGYPFPTNLDRDQPVDRLVPPSQAELVLTAATEAWSSAQLAAALDDYDWRRRSR